MRTFKEEKLYAQAQRAENSTQQSPGPWPLHCFIQAALGAHARGGLPAMEAVGKGSTSAVLSGLRASVWFSSKAAVGAGGSSSTREVRTGSR